jgi:hypothetical protein
MKKLSVWKFPIPVTDFFEIMMPSGAVILSIQTQDNEPKMWCLCDVSQQKVKRFFRMAGTGHDIELEVMEFIDTFQLANGLVFHVFEILEGH